MRAGKSNSELSRGPLKALALAFVLAIPGACDEPCRTDNDCDTAGGIQACNLEEGVCEAISPRPNQACDVDTNCADGRRCVEQECVFLPRCQRFTAPLELNIAILCGANPFEALGTLSTDVDSCETTLELLDTSLNLGSIDPVASVDLAGCNAGAFDSASGALALDGCALVLGDCQVGAVVREAEQPCIIGGQDCPGGGNCEALQTTGDLTVGRCQ